MADHHRHDVAQEMISSLPAPGVKYAMRIRATIDRPQELGTVNDIRKRVIPITGGIVEGPALTGKVLAGGADWQSIRSDGTADLMARYTIEASDGTLISVTNIGYRHGPADVLAKIAAGEQVNPDDYYFRATPRFDVADDSPHAWLGKTIFVCTAARYLDHVRLEIFELT